MTSSKFIVILIALSIMSTIINIKQTKKTRTNLARNILQYAITEVNNNNLLKAHHSTNITNRNFIDFKQNYIQYRKALNTINESKLTCNTLSGWLAIIGIITVFLSENTLTNAFVEALITTHTIFTLINIKKERTINRVYNVSSTKLINNLMKSIQSVMDHPY